MAKGFKIVLMGCDNSGKTTLAKNLVEALNERIEDESSKFKVTHPLGPAPLEKQLKFMDEILFNEVNLVIDRLPIIEEEVAGRIFRNHSNFDEVNNVKMFEYYRNVDFFILCNPPLSTITEWGERAQMDGVKENAKELYEGYRWHYNTLVRELFENGIGSFAKYNWKNDVTGLRCYEIVEAVLMELDSKEEVES